MTQVRGVGLPQSEVFLRGIDREGIVEIVRALVDQSRLRKRYGLTLEDGLAEDIASDLRQDKGSPIAPTLQVLLTKMWKAATAANRTAPRFDRELYEQLKRGDLLRDFLREQLAVVDKTNHDVVESGLVLDVLGQHITDADTAGQRTLAELQGAYTHLGNSVPSLVGDLKNVYLLVDSSEDRADHADSTRLAHDTLAVHVRRTLNSSQAAGQRARRILDNRAVEWQEGATGATLDEADLKRVEQGRAGTRVLSADEERLVAASMSERRARRRRSWVIASVAGVLATVAVGGLVATVRFWRSGQDAERRNKTEQANTRRAEAEARLRASAAFAEKQLGTDQLATLTVVGAIDQSRADLGRVLPALNRALAQVVQEARQVPLARNYEELPVGMGMPAEERPADDSARPAVSPTPRQIPDLAFAGNVLFSPLGDQIRRWELTSWGAPKALDPLKGGEPVTAIASAPKGDRVATGTATGYVAIRGTDGQAISFARPFGGGVSIPSPPEDAITALAFSPDGDFLAIGDGGGAVYLHSVRDGKVEIAVRRGGLRRKPAPRSTTGRLPYGQPLQASEVRAVAVFSDPSLGLTVAAALDDTLAVWNRAQKGWQKQGEGVVDLSRSFGLRSIALVTAGDERGLVTAEVSGTVRVWSFSHPDGGSLGNRILSGSAESMSEDAGDNSFVIGDRIAVLKSGARLLTSSLVGGLIEEHAARGVKSLGLSPNQRWAAYANQEWTGLIDQAGLQVTEPFALRYLAKEVSPLDGPSVVFSRANAQTSGPLAACNGRDVWVLDLDRRYPASARSLANNERDHRVGVGLVGGKEVLVHWGETDTDPGNPSGHRVLMTDWAGTRTGAEIPSEVPDPDADSFAVRTWFDVQGDVAVRGNAGGVVEVFDLAHGKSVANYANQELSATLGVGLAHPGEHLVTVVRDGLVNSLDWAGKWVGIYGCPDPTDCNVSPPSWKYKALAQSFDGKTLAATAPDEVDVWFNATGHGPRARADLNIGQTGELAALALSPDGSVIALAGEKGIQLYDRSGQLFGELPAGGNVEALAFDPSGQLLASVDRANALRLWRVNPDDWLKVACRRLAMSARWADADEHAKHACESVRKQAMVSERIRPLAGE